MPSSGLLRRVALAVFLLLLRLLVTVNFVPISPIHVILLMEALLSPKRWLLQQPQGVTSQKTAFFIVSAVKTLDLA
jgi:hypothetical protein